VARRGRGRRKSGLGSDRLGSDGLGNHRLGSHDLRHDRAVLRPEARVNRCAEPIELHIHEDFAAFDFERAINQGNSNPNLTPAPLSASPTRRTSLKDQGTTLKINSQDGRPPGTAALSPWNLEPCLEP